VIDIVTPGGGLMKSEALKRVRNPGIGKDSNPETPRQRMLQRIDRTRGVDNRFDNRAQGSME
jgi:hypothetical protein